MNPFHRQEILVKRLLRTQQQHHRKQQRQMDHHVSAASSINNNNVTSSSSRKRQLPDQVGSSIRVDNMTEECLEIIDTKNEALWQEISSLLPMLTYGEESNTLLSLLLRLPSDYYSAALFGGQNDGSNNDNNVKRANIYCPTFSSQEQVYFNDTMTPQEEDMMVAKLLSDTVERLLQLKNSSCAQPRDEKRPKREQPQEATTTTIDNTIIRKGHSSTSLLLPWNVLLRVVIRLSAHAAKIWCSSSFTNTNNYCGTCRSNAILDERQTNEIDGQRSDLEDKKSSGMLHPILQALDIILSEIQVSMRISNASVYSSPVKKERYDKNKNEEAVATEATTRRTTSNFSIPQDRFLHDWKRSSHCTRETATSSCWGPSRYEFMKDVESITAMLSMSNQTLGISVTEWQERIHSIVDMLDEQCGGGGVTNGDDQQGQHRYCSPLQSKSTTSLLVDGSCASSPLASVTRDHVKRILNSAEVEKAKCRKHLFQAKGHGVLSPSKVTSPKEEKPSSFLRHNLQQMFKPETTNDAIIMEGETNELDDAYRMAIAFSSLDMNEEVRETIERRLSILMHMLLNNNQSKFPLDGAESYLESLLNTLIQPSDPSVWVRLLNDSGGKETPMMLRRGRAVLVSFLAGLKSPGWKDSINQLRVSPVSSQLGFLSHDEDMSSSEAVLRSLFLLPSLEKDAVTLPPAPIVTEVGLSVCIRNVLEGNDVAANKSPMNTSGVSLFRTFAPYPSSSRNDDFMNSITAPLPNTMELTRDLFDLILRLAADDDSQHQNKSFPLRLVTPSPAESLDIVLQVASDFSDWLRADSISDRYRFILEQVCQSFQSFEFGDSKKGGLDDVTSTSWTSRASTLLHLVKSPQLRARVTLYATQFFILLCGKGGKHKHKASRNSTKQPHFYALLQQRHFSKFWDDIDGAAHGISSRSIISRVFDLSLCQDYILPVALQCSLYLTERSHSSSARKQVGLDALSLVTILTSVLSVLAEDDLLHECTHVGWAVELLSFSFSYHLFGADNALKREDHVDYLPQMLSSTCMWEQAAAQMDKLYNNVWGTGLKKLNNDRQWQTLDTAKNYIAYESIGSNHVAGRMILIPSFNVLASALIKYTCSVSTASDDVAESWCKFVSNIVFDRYIQALGSVSVSARNTPDSFDKTVRSLWIRYLASTLQQLIMEQTTNKMNERSTELQLEDLITPLLRRLHIKVMKRALRYAPIGLDAGKGKEQPDHRLPPDLVATIFTDLFKQESEQFLIKPSPSKTRKWDVYRKCIEKVFLLTPPSTFFAHPSQPGLSCYSSDALAELWKMFGQCNLTQSTLIMVAAGLHVNASATHLLPNQQNNVQDKDLLKQRYNSFSSCAKQCIISSFGCLNVNAKKSSQDSAKFNTLARSVRRDLSFHGEAGIGLTWWNEITNDLYALIEESADQAVHSATSKKAGSRQSDIAAVFSTLQNDLSAISHNQNNTHNY
mmetsp:Transcript_35401/g.72342  ORF Transcript_35401/g.72342 Transcript_35401/m.72342 type:complete len:1457 (+) Transcript_35401:98-4468(+)